MQQVATSDTPLEGGREGACCVYIYDIILCVMNTGKTAIVACNDAGTLGLCLNLVNFDCRNYHLLILE